VHDYELRVVSEVGGAYVEVACRCGDELTGAEARRRINAAGMLSAEDAGRAWALILTREEMESDMPITEEAQAIKDGLNAYADRRDG
jgi:hypothetical protein